jgi:hypothetical protein
MDGAEIAELLALMVVPTLALGLALELPRLVRAVHRLVSRNHSEAPIGPRRPPIEQLAADLRRLLRRHEILTRSTDTLMRAQRLHALEAAIGDCAREAGRALELPDPGPPTGGALTVPQLRRLLRDLADAGLVLPREVGLLAGRPRSWPSSG